MHRVTAWACENRLVLGQEATDEKSNVKAVPDAYTEELDKDHGRLETRRYWITEDLITLPNADKWAGLRSIGRVERECTQAGNTTRERRFFITSIPADAKRFAKAVRGQLAIGCHPLRRPKPQP